MYKKITFTFKQPDNNIISKIKQSGFSAIITNHINIDEALVKNTKRQGLALWTEIKCFEGEELWQKYPNARPIINNTPIEKLGPQKNKWYAGVIPLTKVIEDRINLIQNVLKTYPEIEVLYLDFCRFPGRWEDGTGKAIIANNTENNIQKRIEIISNFVKKVSSLIKSHNKKLGIFLTPYDNPIYGQDIKTLSPLCNFLSPMLYHKICQQPPSWIGQKIEEYARLANKPILPVIQTIPEPTPVTLPEFKTEYQQTRRNNSEGTMILNWESLSEEMRQHIHT